MSLFFFIIGTIYWVGSFGYCLYQDINEFSTYGDIGLGDFILNSLVGIIFYPFIFITVLWVWADLNRFKIFKKKKGTYDA